MEKCHCVQRSVGSWGGCVVDSFQEHPPIHQPNGNREAWGGPHVLSYKAGNAHSKSIPGRCAGSLVEMPVLGGRLTLALSPILPSYDTIAHWPSGTTMTMYHWRGLCLYAVVTKSVFPNYWCKSHLWSLKMGAGVSGGGRHEPVYGNMFNWHKNVKPGFCFQLRGFVPPPCLLLCLAVLAGATHHYNLNCVFTWGELWCGYPKRYRLLSLSWPFLPSLLIDLFFLSSLSLKMSVWCTSINC